MSVPDEVRRDAEKTGACPQEPDGNHGLTGGHRRPVARRPSHAVRVEELAVHSPWKPCNVLWQ